MSKTVKVLINKDGEILVGTDALRKKYTIPVFSGDTKKEVAEEIAKYGVRGVLADRPYYVSEPGKEFILFNVEAGDFDFKKDAKLSEWLPVDLLADVNWDDEDKPVVTELQTYGLKRLSK
jgi:hypothetical protein